MSGQFQFSTPSGKQDDIKLYLAERVPYYTVPKWNTALKDVRNVHFKP